MTVEKTVSYAAWANGVDAHDAPRRAREALALVDLSDRANERVRRLSAGQRQRLGLAAAVAHQPAVLLLDEPSVGLDPQQRVRFRASLVAAARERTVILSSHLLEDIAQVCDQVTVLDEGAARFSGTPVELADIGMRDAATGLAPGEGLRSPL